MRLSSNPLLRIRTIAATFALLAGTSMGSSAPLPDADADGVPDATDNCTNLANATQCDTDLDGYGNSCDGDFDQGGSVSSGDFTIFLADFATATDSGVGTDMDCGGSVSGGDYIGYFLPQFAAGTPGPSGLSCAGTVPCAAPPADALVYGVTPAEALTGSDEVYIQGRGFDLGEIEVVLKDPSDPLAILPSVGIVTRTPHSLRVAIPSFATARAKYQVVVRRDGMDATETVPGMSSYLYRRSSGSAPTAARIRVQYVNWGWVFDCGQAEWEHGTTRRRSDSDPTPCGCSTTGMSGGFPSWYPSRPIPA